MVYCFSSSLEIADSTLTRTKVVVSLLNDADLIITVMSCSNQMKKSGLDLLIMDLWFCSLFVFSVRSMLRLINAGYFLYVINAGFWIRISWPIWAFSSYIAG